jgi:hypothetical protein
VEDAIRRLWPQEKGLPAELAPNVDAGDSIFFKVNALSPTNETQQKLKAMAEESLAQLAEQRALLVAQSETAISIPMLVVVISWLVAIFVGFSLLAPANLTANLALVISTLAVSGAIFLILELDQPFNGVIGIPSAEMMKVLKLLPN